MDTFAIAFGSFVIGAGLVVIGVRQVSPPAGWIALGLFFLVFSILPKVQRK